MRTAQKNQSVSESASLDVQPLSLSLCATFAVDVEQIDPANWPSLGRISHHAHNNGLILINDRSDPTS